MQQNILDKVGVKSTTYCDDFTLTRGLSHGYRKFGSSYVMARENDMAFNTDLRYCSTVGDLYQIWRTVKDKKLVRAQTLKMMSTAHGPGELMSAQDPKMHYGLAHTLNHEDRRPECVRHRESPGARGIELAGTSCAACARDGDALGDQPVSA